MPLRPAMLDDLGLLPALLWLFERYSAQTHVQVDCKHVGLEGRRFGAAIETAAFRIVQEALTNVARHAQVPSVIVRLWSDPNMLGVQIEDYGIGFDPKTASAASSGLTGMRERASAHCVGECRVMVTT
jgi:signal transduction histidine kinase